MRHSSTTIAAADIATRATGLKVIPTLLGLVASTLAGQDAPPPNPLFDTQSKPGTTAPEAASTTANAMQALTNRLVEKGLLAKDEAQVLVKLAEADIANAVAKATATSRPPPGPNDVRVTYVPEIVKNQLRDEIKQELAGDQEWIDRKLKGAGTFPDWINRWEPFGDVRLRYEYDSYPSGNDNTGAFPNFNAINTGSPYDVSSTQFSPQNNVDQDRQRMRLRLRLGTDINLGDGFTAGVRVGTGESNSPVSGNQSLGTANQGQGGNFSKYAIWLDRAFLRYDVSGDPNNNLALLFGRFDNPFMSTTMIWSEDLGFDGVAFKGRHQLTDKLVGTLTGGLFPVFNTDLNFSSNAPAKFKSTDKWLYAAQAGVEWKATDKIDVRSTVAYYHFDGVEGKLSTPYIPLSAQDAGDTDDTRPSFAQKGNTYRPLRQIIPSVLNNFGTTNQYQYFGLATPFHELAYDFQIDLNHFEPAQISLIGEYVKNLAFNSGNIDKFAVNNRGSSAKGIGTFEGDDSAWYLALRLGKAKFEKAGDWQASFGYRYVGSDAVVDGFNDQDFGGGGTNVEGFTIGASIALSPKVRLGLKWMSANEIAGPALKSDIVQFDLQAKF